MFVPVSCREGTSCNRLWVKFLLQRNMETDIQKISFRKRDKDIPLHVTLSNETLTDGLPIRLQIETLLSFKQSLCATQLHIRFYQTFNSFFWEGGHWRFVGRNQKGILNQHLFAFSVLHLCSSARNPWLAKIGLDQMQNFK